MIITKNYNIENYLLLVGTKVLVESINNNIEISINTPNETKWFNGEVCITFKSGFWEPLDWFTVVNKKYIQSDFGKKQTIRTGKNTGSSTLVCDKSKIKDVIKYLESKDYNVTIVESEETKYIKQQLEYIYNNFTGESLAKNLKLFYDTNNINQNLVDTIEFSF